MARFYIRGKIHSIVGYFSGWRWFSQKKKFWVFGPSRSPENTSPIININFNIINKQEYFQRILLFLFLSVENVPKNMWTVTRLSKSKACTYSFYKERPSHLTHTGPDHGDYPPLRYILLKRMYRSVVNTMQMLGTYQ